jgi:hypothetical protein
VIDQLADGRFIGLLESAPEAMGGRLNVTSGPGAGSEVDVWLPDFEVSGGLDSKERS